MKKMSILKILILALMMFFNAIKTDAQSDHIYNVPGPEVANIGLYGTIPVSHFTGIPDISIPLYTVNVGTISIPITANYHIAAVKPSSAPSSLGLGWSLRSGGYITRTVHGVYDEKKGTDGVGHGFYDHAYKMKNMTNADFDSHTKNTWSSSSSPYYELSADEFSFNFCGYTGSFYINEDGGWTVVSDDNIEVEFNPNTDFISLQQLKSRIDVHAWGNQSENNRYFCRFTLKTPDGCRYEFGGIDAIDFSIPYYSRNNSDLVATSWHLRKITTPDNNIVNFEYDTSALMCDLKYVPQYYEVFDIEVALESPYRTGQKAGSGFLLFPVNIKSIETDKEKISFYYYPDQAYGNSFITGCLFWKDISGATIFDLYRGYLDNPYNQFNAFMKRSGSEKEIAQNLYCPILHRMAISNKCGGKSHSLYFDYTYDNRRKLSLITQRDGVPDIIKQYDLYPDNIVITRYKIPENTSGINVAEYSFSYNIADKLPAKYVYADTDSWGYYNGRTIDVNVRPDFKKKIPFERYMKAEILTSVKYPTGGSSVFEYEGNRYSKRVNEDRTDIENMSGTSGGLRISKIINHDSDGKIINTKKYYYSETRSESGKSSGISKGEPCLAMRYVILQKVATDNYPTVTIASEGGFFPSVSGCTTPDVGYSCVIEETLDADGNSLGYVKYRYSNFDTDIFSRQHMDVPPFYAYGITCSNAITPYTDFSYERGKLLSKEYYDSNGRCVRKESIRYQATPHSTFTTATQEMLFVGDLTYHDPVRFGWLTKTRTCSYLPVATDIVEYSSTGSTAYTESSRHAYNTYKLPSCDSILMSNAKWMVTKYEYPFNLTQYSQYKKMTDLHIINPVVNKTVTANGVSRAEKNEYGITGSIPYISKRTSVANGNTRTEYEVTKTDMYGNPIEITENGTTSVLVWGGYGQKLIARYANATYRQIKYALNLDIESYSTCSLQNINYTRLESIRSLMPFALSYIYKYNGNMLLRSQTDSNGFTTYYVYDIFDRLRETCFYDDSQTLIQKNVINQYDYHYNNAE